MDWSNTPEGILDLILSNLFFEDRHSFSLVCRFWNQSVVDSYRHSPCLLSNHLSNHSWKVFQHNTFLPTDLLKLDEDASILCANHGWLLMHYKSSSVLCTNIFFLDPFNNERIEVPDPTNIYTTISFVHPPTSPDCFVVGINCVEGQPVELGVLRLGEDEWKTSFADHLRTRIKFQPSLASPILYHGRLFFVDVRGNIATFDPSPDDNETAGSGIFHTKCLKKRRHRRDIIEHYLVKPTKGEDEIFGVFVQRRKVTVRQNSRKANVRYIRKVNVYRFLRNYYWKPVDDLGDRVFYVSNGSTFGYKTENKRLANKIFFSEFYGDKIVFYSLDTKKYHCFEGDCSSKESFGIATCDYDVSNGSTFGCNAGNKRLANKKFFPGYLDTRKYHCADCEYLSEESFDIETCGGTWIMPAQIDLMTLNEQLERHLKTAWTMEKNCHDKCRQEEDNMVS